MAKPQKIKKHKTKKHLAREQREARQVKIIITITIVVAAVVVVLILYGVVTQLIITPRIHVIEIGDNVITVADMNSRVEYTRVQMLSQAEYYYEIYELYSLYYSDYADTYLYYAQTYVSELMQAESLASDVLNEMIDEIIIREEAAERGITVSEEEVDEAIEDAFGFYPEGTYTPTVTSTTLPTPTYSGTELSLVTLTYTPSATSPATETPEVTATPTEGPTSTETELVEEEAEETVVEATETPAETPTPSLSPTITQSPTVTPTPTTYTTEVFAEDIDEFNEYYEDYNFDIDDYWYIFETELLRVKLMEMVITEYDTFQEEVWARHILVETEEEAQEVYELLMDGGDFHELAAEYSTDTSTSDIGGDLGWFDDETMVDEFTEVAFSLEPGEISEPFETTYGFHIVQVLGKRENQIDDDDLEEDIEEAFDTWLSEVRSTEYEVELNDEWEEYASDYPQLTNAFISEVYQLDE